MAGDSVTVKPQPSPTRKEMLAVLGRSRYFIAQKVREAALSLPIVPQERINMTRHRDIVIPASAAVSISASPAFTLAGAYASYYPYYFGSFSGRYA
ncbi:MAG: hypothetical protein GW855_09145 [Erythrobacter sp.]|nr:hypothetical protein [Erythrobacter sp.]NCQ63559.1 hypothetical protein [Alphaproteobacteria bacterium]